MRPWQMFLLILVLAFFAVSSAWRVLYVLTYVLLFLFVLSWLWTRYSLRHIAFRRNPLSNRVQVGETFDERLMLDNLSHLPRLWIQITDGSTLPGHRAGYVASIAGRKRAIWRARTNCRLRGRFQLGPITATSGDPFGLFRRSIVLSPVQELVVMPRVYPLHNFSLFTGGLPGRGSSTRKAFQTTTNATTIRDYVMGDALSRIHWRSSAHYNKLMVREFDIDPAADIWVFLDLNAAVQAGNGEHSTVEYGVTIAASISHYLLRQDLSVGLIVHSDQREILPLDRGERQIERMLALLAVVNPAPGPALNESLALDAFQFSRNDVVIVITPSHARDWHESLIQLRRRGVQVSVIGLDASSFQNEPPDEDNLALLEGFGLSVIRVKNGDPIASILEQSAVSRFS